MNFNQPKNEVKYSPSIKDDSGNNINGMEVPQLSPDTNISNDYFNQINAVVSFYKMKRGGIARVKEFLEESLKEKGSPFRIKKYEEVYSGYKDVINDKNRKSIERLDELVDHFNKILNDIDSMDDEDFCKTYNEIIYLIYGKDGTKI